nr:hypothetical protein [Tanacetum cinerariifolium]
MTRSTDKRLTKPLDEPKREFQRLKRAAWHLQQNESLAISERNLFDDEASSSNNTRAKPQTPPKTLHEHSHPNPSRRTSSLRDLIPRFKQGDDEPIKSARISFHELIKQVPHHGIQKWLLNDNTLPWGNNKHNEKGEDSPEWIVRYKFEDEFANFMLEKKSHAKGIRNMLDYHQRSEGKEPSIIQELVPQPSIFYQPSKSSNLSFLSRLKKQKKDDEDERFLSIFKQIHINLPFLEAMIHMTKGAKVLKDLLSHKEKLKKAASSVKLSEECYAIIQRSLPKKERNLGSFTLPCLIRPLAVKNVIADLRASINLMPHSLFQRLGISKLKATKISIQLADRSIKYPIGVCENLLMKISKFIFPVDFMVLGRRRANPDHFGAALPRHGKSYEDSNEVLAVSFYPKTKSMKLLEWKAQKKRLKPSSMEPPKLELKELTEHLEYAFLQENNQLPVVISSALSTVEKARLLEVLRNNKGAIAWSIADVFQKL